MIVCKCTKRSNAIKNDAWKILRYHSSCSAFNGYHRASSDYSTIICLKCGAVWRTKAEYVEKLIIAEKEAGE